MPTKKKVEHVRVNTRITEKQHKFIKAKAVKMGLTEGEVTRIIIDEYIKNNPK